MTGYIPFTLWWLAFFAMHSLLASSSVKGLVTKQLPLFKPYYRLFYNITAVLLLIPAIMEYYRLPAEPLFGAGATLTVAGAVLALAGVYILVAGFKNYRADEFIGTYQLRNKDDFHPSQLSRTGWNGVVRHPLYFGGILLAVGLLLVFPTIKLGLATSTVIAYLYIGTLWEEKKLVAEFGDTYRSYQREVSMLLPVKWVLVRLKKVI